MDELHRLAERTSAGAGASPAQPNPNGDAQPKGNLMVVDDQPANLKLLEDLLTQQGHTVRSFPRGRLALEATARNLPDLILLFSPHASAGMRANPPELHGYGKSGYGFAALLAPERIHASRQSFQDRWPPSTQVRNPGASRSMDFRSGKRRTHSDV